MSKNQGKKCQKHRKIFQNVEKPEKSLKKTQKIVKNLEKL